MARSAAFLRIKADVLAIVRAIPPGRVGTYAAIGRELDVMARHVAYIMATLTPEERDATPWHRVVSDTGALNRTKHGRGAEQRALLTEEGVAISPKGSVVDLDRVFWSPD